MVRAPPQRAVAIHCFQKLSDKNTTNDTRDKEHHLATSFARAPPTDTQRWCDPLQTSLNTMRTRAQDGDPSALDVGYLAGTYGVPEPDLQTLLSEPTVELVQNLFVALTGKGAELDALKADKVKAEVELENTVRSSETKVKAQKAAVARHTKEIEELRTKLNEADAAREALSSEIEQLRSSTTGSTAETQQLRQRIETLEASNRDALALVESKSSEKDRVATELSEQHSKLLALRREVGQLEERNQTLENAASSQKFKEQSLQQEIDLLKRNNEWHSNELQTRNQEHAKFRKERNVRISNLERELEESNATVEALKRSETTLKKRLEELQAKLDETLARNATLEGETDKKEEDFKTELSSAKRLAELQAQNAATHKARSLELQNELDQVKDDIREEVSRLQTEIETERMDKEEAERKFAELELKYEELERRGVRPGTPRHNGGGDPATPGRGSRTGSPSALPGSMRRSVGGLSFTQLYTQYSESQEALAESQRRNDHLASTLDELVSELEQKKPEIDELRADQERLEDEVLNLSKLFDEANEGRRRASEEANEMRRNADAAVSRQKILEQQCRDLSAQVKILLVEIQSRDEGLGELSAEERLELERAARGELEGGALDGMTDTGRLISERLVIFRNVSELQSKYQDALEVTRRLGDSKEALEALEQEAAEKTRETEELRQSVKRYEEELKATTTQIESYVKERDMFRRMLQHRGQIAPDADLQSMFGQSVGPATPQRQSMAPPATPRSKETEDFNRMIKDQQNIFDQFRNEWNTDRRTLNDQIDALAREKSSLQAQFARADSQRTLSEERYKMLESNFNALRTENGELQKRSQYLSEQAAKQDLRTQQVAEELVEARSMTDSLRNENANIKAEKDLWKRIEARLTEDNKNLMDERSRLNKLVADLQNLQNERELADSETRRRLQGRIDALEAELSETQTKLKAEVEENKTSAQRREYQENQNRTRIDDLVKSLGHVREELVAAKTTRDQLQSRVDEMKIELRSAEEKVAALQPRPTPRAEPGQNGLQQSNGEDQELSSEQRLALEASELRRDLELSKTELENAKQQVEQYKSIAQSTEEELANFNETSDQYKEDTDRELAEKESKIKELEQRVEDLVSELTSSNNELSELRTKVEDNDRVLAEQKASYEAELSRLRDDVERHGEEKKLFQEDIKAQAEIAQQAQQSYEDELVKHAEAARSLQNVRKEYNELRTEVAGLRAEAEAAKASLESGEESWAEQRARFETELEEVKRKRHDVDEQNRLLHQNLDAFSNELAALRQGRTVEGGREGSPSGEENQQEIIRYLRREKEILDAQYEVSMQESQRLQHQLDYAHSQLEDAREKLAEERRQSSNRESSEGSTNKLAQTINELNLFRESATTLRNEARQAREKLEEKSKEVERLVAEMEPLKGRVGELEGELESKEGEMKLLQDDRDHWRERTQNIISKYDRVDPAEMEELKKQLEELKAEKERLESEQAPLQEQIAGIDARVESEKATATQELRDRLEKFKTQAKEQDRKRQEKIREVNGEKEGLASELEKAKASLAAANTELEQTKTALEQAKASASKPDDTEEGQVQEDGVGAGNEDHAALHAKIAEAQASAAEHSSRADALNAEVEKLQTRVQELEGQVQDLQQQLATAQAGATSGDQATAPLADNAEGLEKLRQELATAQQEVETLRANASSGTVNAQPAPGEKSVADQVAEEVAKLRAELEKQHELSKTQLDENFNKKIEGARANMNKKLQEEREKQRTSLQQELQAEHSAEIQRLKDEHEAAIEKLKAEHHAELERLKTQGGAAVEKAESAEPIKREALSEDVDLSTLEISETQARTLIKQHPTIRELMIKNIRSAVGKETEKNKAVVEEKDVEIAKLKEAIEKTPAGETAQVNGEMVTREELEKQLEAAKKEKEAAVRQTQETMEKKAKVQLSSRDMANAKIAALRKIVTETPEKPVKEAWEVAEKAKPPPKPTAAAAPASPAVAKPSAAPSSPATTGSFGQPSRPAGSPPNPQAAEFTPSSSTTENKDQPPASTQNKPASANNTAAPAVAPRSLSQSGIPAPGGAAGGSKLPRAPSRQGSMSGAGMSIQGAAQGQPGLGQRGGHQASGLPRGGLFGSQRGRGGINRGGMPANAGQKRQHDGNGEGGDAKRTRGGPAGGSA